MFDWIDFDDALQVHWAKVYIKRITTVEYYDELDDPKDWEVILLERKKGPYYSKDLADVVKNMRAAWRKRKSKQGRRFNASPAAKKERPFSLTNKAINKLDELAEKHGVTKSQVVESLILGEKLI